MALAKCARCAKIFNKLRETICPACFADEEADRGRLRDVLDAQPELSAKALAEAAGVDVEVVLRMLDAGILVNDTVRSDIKCGRCGAPAISRKQKLCPPCLDELNRGVRAARESIRLKSKKSVRVGREQADVRRTVDEKRRTE